MGEALEGRAARVLGLVRGAVPADAALRGYLAAHRRLGAAERRALSRAVFAYFRWLRWLEPGRSAPGRIAAALELQARFEADPSSVKAEALAARAVPGWLAGEMELGPGFLRQLQREPVLWIRAKAGARDAVARALGSCEEPVLPPSVAPPEALAALRYLGAADLHRAAGFESGQFEIQDLASQLAGHACAPRPGETWWDACAGEGGKTLHLSDLMGGRGLVWATDRSARRRGVLRRRAARAGAVN